MHLNGPTVHCHTRPNRHTSTHSKWISTLDIQLHCVFTPVQQQLVRHFILTMVCFAIIHYLVQLYSGESPTHLTLLTLGYARNVGWCWDWYRLCQKFRVLVKAFLSAKYQPSHFFTAPCPMLHVKCLDSCLETAQFRRTSQHLVGSFWTSGLHSRNNERVKLLLVKIWNTGLRENSNGTPTPIRYAATADRH